MYLIIVHGHNTIHWAKSYSELFRVLRDANKWSEILGGQAFPYNLSDLVNEFYDDNGTGKITFYASDDGYMISIMWEGDPV